MKKRSKKVLAFGVAALMALSSLPASILTATAAIGANQTANGGTSYNFVLKDMATDSNTVEVSSDDVAAGNVSRTIGVYIDSEEWSRDAYIHDVLEVQAGIFLTAVLQGCTSGCSPVQGYHLDEGIS